MTVYMRLGSVVGTSEATALGARLAEWHDAMVSHERRLRAGTARALCDDECPHAEAERLWDEAVALFGAHAHELSFLRSRADRIRRS